LGLRLVFNLGVPFKLFICFSCFYLSYLSLKSFSLKAGDFLSVSFLLKVLYLF